MTKEKELSYQMRSCLFEVYRQLGHGYLEKVYETALTQEFTTHGLRYENQVAYDVDYKGTIIGHYLADLVVKNKVIIEIKTQNKQPDGAEARLLNYLRASQLFVGLLVNFTFPKTTIKRLVL